MKSVVRNVSSSYSPAIDYKIVLIFRALICILFKMRRYSELPELKTESAEDENKIWIHEKYIQFEEKWIGNCLLL